MRYSMFIVPKRHPHRHQISQLEKSFDKWLSTFCTILKMTLAQPIKLVPIDMNDQEWNKRENYNECFWHLRFDFSKRKTFCPFNFFIFLWKNIKRENLCECSDFAKSECPTSTRPQKLVSQRQSGEIVLTISFLCWTRLQIQVPARCKWY